VWGECHRVSCNNYVPILRMSGAFSPFITIHGTQWDEFTIDVHGSVHHSTYRIEITNKMQPCSGIYYSIAS